LEIGLKAKVNYNVGLFQQQIRNPKQAVFFLKNYVFVEIIPK